MAAGHTYSHRPVIYSTIVPADGQCQAIEYTINFKTLPGFGTGRRNMEYRHIRQAMFVGRNTMDAYKLHKILSIINLIIISTLFADTFFIKPLETLETFNSYTSIETRSLPNLSHWTNFIVANSGNKYREPYHISYTLSESDTFYVLKTRMFKRPINLIYPQTTPKMKVNTGGLNEWGFMLVIVGYIILISFLHLFNIKLTKKKNLNERLIFSATALLCFVIFAYFYQ